MEEKKSAGTVAAIIVIIIVLALGALYFWTTSLSKKVEEQKPVVQAPAEVDPAVQSLEQRSSSDDIEALKKDLADTNLNLDADLQADQTLR